MQVMTTATAMATTRREIEVISLVGFGHGVSHFFHLLIPPLFPWLMQEFGLSFTEAGAMTAVFFAVSGVGQALAGFVVDHVGARRVLFSGIAFFVVAALVLSVAQSYGTLLLAAAIAGVGNCVFHPADFTLLNRNVSAARLGHAFSVHGLAGNLGWALAPVFMTGIAVTSGWRTAAMAAALLALVSLVLLFVRREAMHESRIHTDHALPVEASASTFAFLGSGAVWMSFMFFFLVTIAFGALQNFAPSLLHGMYGLSLAAGASGLTAFWIGSAAGMAAGGFLVARSEAHDVRIAAVLITAAVFASILASGAVPGGGVVPVLAAMGFFGGMAGPSRDMLVRRAATARFGQRSYGRVYGFVYSGLDTGLAIAPFIFGPLMDAGRFALVLTGVAVAQTLAVFTALRVGRGVKAQ
jgi:FSR family fosmidomycin resistance protein-like MFS transporter